MSDLVGLLKVIVSHGKKMAIRDFRSSDPYVIVRVGNATAKTKVINSCLNPVWNEEFTFDIKEPPQAIQFEVFDKDRFKHDDKMGHAFIDLQPIFSASKLKRALQSKLTTSEMKLRKVAPNSENCLLEDSFVMYLNGDVVFDARLRLCDVETGELFVKVKWFEGVTTSVSSGLK
ncbi:Calcium-dependent lipid-binding (CaLB domain) family protein [Rhynchospora pubera]|uniref:Calcium-dependent lipid-binding (CaLB domain) family protein n=2 Tax=Rhynchospora pubera TaxID=906938 RepID=A0AAV8D962_9POAL|nr:Calcium-dependent lipid-binding (CaLB domain) family protein [Rhynchospora pubera]KAJ4763200.1 Calcium-dependent lipid-binding (CaLB domain) family protein [Rhynchospora pubera]KAJ4791870.1 Calcium-dependent lipid-binding (CaLB domain) family protein [Rhynchospora pubera]